ncbi:DUF389 domain-containing protein [Atopomonas sediminilitoris]|uniref:DUF389 domain-containing protein n=1 Tax=Atopomonas sediminilitoris TaxID=2919919 RepID=UPI001F4D7C82|nr:DUF389 domain-containing protein [Atopomonas sediminilitoris]MCJ8167887.1 DUF389 domain-containing protein [Atopomonas sediminilitoris]
MSQISRALLVVGQPDCGRIEAVKRYASEQGISLDAVDESRFVQTPAECLQDHEHLVVVIDDEQLAGYLDIAERIGCSLGVVPREKQLRLHEWFSLPRNVDQAIELAFSEQTTQVDVLRCNGETTLGLVMLGDTPFIDSRSKAFRNRDHSFIEHWLYRFALVWLSLRNLFGIKPFPIRLTTTREEGLNTAITGLVAIENDVRGPAARLVNTSLSVQDGLISTLVIAPKSVGEYLAFLFTSIFQGERPLSKLPRAVSFIRCPELCIESKTSLAYFIDGQAREAERIELKLHSKAVAMKVPEDYFGRAEGKEVHRTEQLPRKAERLKMIEEHLPLFTHALEDEFRDLFVILRDMARPHSTFLTLMVLSAIVASLGLFLSSPAVIIGAMVLAPLMAPIISLAMGLLRGERGMLVQSLQTIAIGVALAMGTSALVALMIPVERITPEIAGRLQPNLLDLGVAIASGIAGAYANVREDVAKSVSGVAIAVALVPPLCVSGIGLGWMDWYVISGAMLLFLTNLVGISLAAALTFLFLGYAPLVRAKRGLTVSLMLLVLVSIPLTISFVDMARHWQIEKLVVGQTFIIQGKEINLSNLQVNLKGKQVVLHADVLSRSGVTYQDMSRLKAILERELDRPIQLELTPRISL